MRVLFLGTPEFAVPSLSMLMGWNAVQVVGLVTQPDRPSGRGNKLSPPPTKVLALSQGIPVLQPEKLSKAPDVVQAMQDLKPDILVTVAFGQILKKAVLNMAPHGVMNVHGSLLPKYRGAAPINWAIINGEKVTGVTTMFSDAGIDTGKMLLKREIPLSEDIDAESLAEAMSHVGAELLKETLQSLMNGTLLAIEQNNDEASYAPLLKKEMGRIDWTRGSTEIHNLVRGLYPWPGTYTDFDSQQLKIIKTRVCSSESSRTPGEIVCLSGAFIVACGEAGRDRLEIIDVKPANKGKMSAGSWANGLRIKAGASFASTPAAAT